MEHDDFQSPVLGRRQILRRAGFGLVGLGLTRLAGAAPVLGALAQDLDLEPDLDIGDLVGDPSTQAVCDITPSSIQGPYYLDLNLVRRDISEGMPGLKTRILLHVVRSSDCSPIPNAELDLWHNEALGKYSGFANQGTLGLTFMRGVQFTDDSGFGFFDSVFPGWYPGRTTHMHLKVRPTPNIELTTQLYFEQGLINRIYMRPPYTTHGDNPTTNASDGFFLDETVMSVVGFQSGRLYLELTIGLS